MLNAEYKQIHRLDKVDIGISAFAGIIGAVVDILLVGIPQKTPNGLSAGRLSDFIREKFDEVFPADEMEKLANSKLSKVPYDAQDNRNTIERVTGLSAKKASLFRRLWKTMPTEKKVIYSQHWENRLYT